MPDPAPKGSGADPGAEAVTRALLDRVGSPAELKALPLEDLPRLCEEIRAFLLDTVQATGGHLGSNLGVVEMTVALHRVYDFARDRIVFDTSHQSYVHKILTGRRDRFDSLRQTDGLCGFTHPHESPSYDMFHLGHAGTSVSLGVGMAIAAASQHPDVEPGRRPEAVAVIGDSALGAGVAFEALNHAGSRGEKLLVVLNDNEWSISQSVGALAKYLSRIRTNKTLVRARQEIGNLVASIPVIGDKVERTLDQVREVLRHAVISGHVFEELGVRYVGPLDGHDVQLLVEQLEKIRQLDGCVLLHTLTHKGKGHPDAPEHPERVHAAKPPKSIVKPAPAQARYTQESEKVLACEDRRSGTCLDAGPAYTAAFGEAALESARRDLRVHAITAGMPSGTGLTKFAEEFPTRFHDVGITEQHGVAMAAGMAKGGLRPLVTIYSTFLQRAYDQVFQEVALQNLPVAFAMDRAGLVGQDGPTHNGVFDIAILRTLPNFVLCAPRDATDMRRMIRFALEHDGPVGVRYPRASCPGRERIPESERAPMVPGKAEVLLEGDELVVWAYGALVPEALLAAERLRERGIQIGVVDARFAKPLDEDLLADHVRRFKHLVTLEEHQRAGGFGSAVLEAASRLPERRCNIRVLGVPDAYQEHCTQREEQLARCGIDAAGLERTVTSLLRRVPQS
ncbi:MAG: 1-deoxy-D-xylulose-5-phosphate synthase [Planctomycetota bacterium]